MLESITRESAPWGLAEAVHRQPEGNPVVRDLAEEGLIKEKEGRWRPTKETSLEMNIPEGLHDVIGKRLSRLSPECSPLLSLAAAWRPNSCCSASCSLVLRHTENYYRMK
jgi:hypothetical protein